MGSTKTEYCIKDLLNPGKEENKIFSEKLKLKSNCVLTSAADRLIGEVLQSRRRPLLGPSPG